jgi:subtilase family serine protease
LRIVVIPVRAAAARLAAAVLALPVLLGGGAAPAIVSHAVSPAMGGLAQFQDLGDASDLTTIRTGCPIPICYTPAAFRTAYDIQHLIDAGTTGAGTTIVIVDAFQNPNIRQDLAQFDAAWDLPPANLDIKAPDGLTAFDKTSTLQKGWAVEISLDVEWAHAIAPGADLMLVLAKSEQDTDLLSATRFAIDHGLGEVITQSFGESESCADPALLSRQHAVFERAASRGITLLAASGDLGATNPLCAGPGVASTANVSTPASDPDVTAVGGTSLVVNPASGAYVSETAWNETFHGQPVGASGGGFSAVYRRPGYQAPFIDDNSARGLPDVAYSSGLIGAPVVVAMNRVGPGVGTSAGTPQWAGIDALARQFAGHRQSQLNIRLYHVAKSDGYSVAFHDITTGNNTFDGVKGFSAGPGWDAVTGLGTPDVAKLVPLLAIPAGD